MKYKGHDITVEWIDDDNCFVGLCPGLFFGGVHGDNCREVLNELRVVVDGLTEILTEQEHG